MTSNEPPIKRKAAISAPMRIALIGIAAAVFGGSMAIRYEAQDALTRAGIAAGAAVFFIVAIYWIFRMEYPQSTGKS